MLFDLHSHTTASDGRLSPQDLVRRAAERQVDVLAITDHDTVAGLAPAEQAIEAENLPLTLIKGIEISTLWSNFDIHIVGLNIEPEHPAIVRIIEERTRRADRAALMGERLEKNRMQGHWKGPRPLPMGLRLPVPILPSGLSSRAMPRTCRPFSKSS